MRSGTRRQPVAEHNFLARLQMAIEAGWLPRAAYETSILHRNWCPFLEANDKACTCDCIITLKMEDGTEFRVGEQGERMELQ